MAFVTLASLRLTSISAALASNRFGQFALGAAQKAALRITMRRGMCLFALWVAAALPAAAQNPAQIVQQAVQTEIDANQKDNSRWLFYDVDRKPNDTVQQWVAETNSGDLHRVMAQKGQPTSTAQQRNIMERFINDPGAQDKQRKAGQSDDRQSEELLKLLPGAFNWSISRQDADSIYLHFKPDPNFKPPSWAARVFAAMEGDMQVDKAEHRIVSLKGRMIRDVKFCGGICGSISSGGTFNVERRKTGGSVWQITETHVHIRGSVLFFKSISQVEDDVRTRFERLPDNITLRQAEADLMKKVG
jgi:hypothetical protein